MGAIHDELDYDTIVSKTRKDGVHIAAFPYKAVDDKFSYSFGLNQPLILHALFGQKNSDEIAWGIIAATPASNRKTESLTAKDLLDIVDDEKIESSGTVYLFNLRGKPLIKETYANGKLIELGLLRTTNQSDYFLFTHHAPHNKSSYTVMESYDILDSNQYKSEDGFFEYNDNEKFDMIITIHCSDIVEEDDPFYDEIP